ncbi:hypothetical protein CNMCM5623_004120 [Aspergillus felis]|uniref:Transcription factor domain-containing protein n=1 Tax=Aspergillus felis TaxID=1287682 RepID=A0A8H6PQ47_9EURO|nr:hypothetical protein CNMCM5623_004120 [Aspergillus felis]
MSSLTYVNEAGAGQKHSDLCHYSQAVLLPANIVKCAEQGGWTNSGDLDDSDVKKQIDLAFENVDRVLQAAGLKGTRERDRVEDERMLSSPVELETSSHQNNAITSHHTSHYRDTMRDARCAFLLIAFATWQKEEDIAREAFDLQSFLARCVRECQLEEAAQPLNADATDWRAWIQQETDRRVKLFSFALLTLQSLAFGTSPVILTDEVRVRLPYAVSGCSLSHHETSPEAGFPNAYPVPSPLANYILLHALIQQILLAYRTLGPYNEVNKTLMNGQKEIMRIAEGLLILFSSSQQRASRLDRSLATSLDPRNPNGPVTFTSTALLGVAYVRLGLDLGSYRILRSRDAKEIASRLVQMPTLPAGPYLLPAILHATHALSIPVKLGVNFVAQSHAFVWSVQHSLCGLEFAIFLSKWLFCIADCQTRRPLDEHESRLVTWITDIVEEGRTSGDDDLWSRPPSPSDCFYLGYAVAKLWARLIRGDKQWLLLKVIGDGLDIYADTCERNYAQPETVVSVPTSN